MLRNCSVPRKIEVKNSLKALPHNSFFGSFSDLKLY